MPTIKTFWTTMNQNNGSKWWNALDRMKDAEKRRAEGRKAKGHEQPSPVPPECDWRRLVKKAT